MATSRNIIREQNIFEIKKFLFQKGKAVANEISEETSISMVTVHSILKDLVAEGLIFKGESVQSDVGRPATIYEFNYEQHLSLHLSLIEHSGKGEVIGEVVNLAGEVKDEISHTLKEHSQAEVAQRFEEIYTRFSFVDQLGIMLPGKIHEGIVVSGWEGILTNWHIERSVRGYTDKPFFVQNDAHLITVGYSVQNNLPKAEMIIGIYYPEGSHPGITIYSHGEIIEGQYALAGEAKYFPNLMEKGMVKSTDELLQQLNHLLTIYNVALAPHRFLFVSDIDLKDEWTKIISENKLLEQQINQPSFEYMNNFFEMSRIGLQWLIYKDTPYAL
jgi:DNA-binding PadR family transcriptional regulator